MPKSRTKFAAVTPNAAPGSEHSRVLRGSRHQRGFFYKLKKQGEGPREMKVGARTLITLEAAAEWRRAARKCHAGVP